MSTLIRLGARLRAARKAAGFKTAKELVKKHHVPASTYSQHESGARCADDETLKFYSQVFGVSLQWLKTGKGNPYIKSNLAKANVLREELIDLKKYKPADSIINQKALTEILSALLNHLNTNLSSQLIDLISKMTPKIYIEVCSSPEIRQKIIKSAIIKIKKNKYS